MVGQTGVSVIKEEKGMIFLKKRLFLEVCLLDPSTFRR